MKRIIFLITMLCVLVPKTMAQRTVSGTITDAGTGETLIGATVVDALSGKGTVTNVYGFYTLTLRSDTADLRFTYTGYKSRTYGLHLSGNTTINVALTAHLDLQEVVITADRVTSPKVSQMSAIEVPVEHIKMVPTLFGETDVLKALQLLPGVQGGSEGMSGMYVRGGGPDENLFLLDGVPLYNVNHLGGFFSAFNSDAIKNVTLYKGSFPAHFSGRISSVLDITTNNGNDREYHGSINIGALASKISLEGPIIKEKTTFSVSVRRTYFDLLMRPFISGAAMMSDGTSADLAYYFYDVNAKVTHKFSDRSRLYASLYMGDDHLHAKVDINDGSYFSYYTFKESFGIRYDWGNLTSALRWNYVINPRLFMNLTASFTRYRNNLGVEVNSDNYWDGGHTLMDAEMSYNSGISDFTARADFDYTPSPEHNIRFGGSLTHHIFRPEVTGAKYNVSGTDTAMNEHLDTTFGQSVVTAQEFMLYAEDDYSITEALKVNGGLVFSGFLVQGKPYFSPQPRLSGRYMLTDDLSVKVGYAYMTQYLHLLSSSNISLPTDLWVPVTKNISPMNSHQMAAGVFYSWRSIVDFSVEGYYKWMNNLMEYKNGSSFWGGSAGWEDKVCLGRGWAYGVEFLAQKTIGDITGWIGYTWSKTMRLFDRPGQELNNGLPFPAKYDRRHDISIVLTYKPSKKFDLCVTWVYSTGNTATIALQEIPSDYYDPANNYHDIGPLSGLFSDGDYYPYVESRNNYRLPAYHRMDISLNLHKQKKHGIRTWSFSVYNLYNRNNPYTVYKSYKYHTTIGNTTYGSSLVQLSIFPMMPSVAYIYKF